MKRLKLRLSTPPITNSKNVVAFDIEVKNEVFSYR